MEVLYLQQNSDYNKVMDVLLQLRPSYNRQSLSEQVQKQITQGYQVVYVKSDQDVLAAAGFVVGEKLAWGKHVYIDDLVTSESSRSTGVGAFLIDWFKAYCLEHNCEQLHLDSGVQRFSAHRFYLSHRFDITSHHFALTEISSS
ncbi:GNAT family N-acetyltransferase [Vibrio sp.]|uniref:GNAT family N-acetyltransferase n=1 Tax=Vibrio sp. TaxID=678 RepID=UPI003D10258F